MNENWTDFEKYVFDRLEANHQEHSEIKTEIAVLKERVKPKKSRKWIINIGGVGALLAAIWSFIKGGA